MNLHSESLLVNNCSESQIFRMKLFIWSPVMSVYLALLRCFVKKIRLVTKLYNIKHHTIKEYILRFERPPSHIAKGLMFVTVKPNE
jgi:hypothetical protein